METDHRTELGTEPMQDTNLSLADQGLYPETVQGTCQWYNKWAKTYDPELQQFGYNAPKAAVDTLEKWLTNKHAHIMDLACGTGLVGEQLVKRGFTSIDGLDISSESTEVSKGKKIYQRLICGEVGTNKLDIKDATYNAVLCVGSFVPGHINHSCFPELVRIVKPGSFIMITTKEVYLTTCSMFNEGKFEGAVQELVQKGVWEVAAREPVKGYLGKHKGVTFVFKLL